jgi:hypothetical protein
MSAIDRPRAAPKEIAVDSEGYIIDPGALAPGMAPAPRPPAPPGPPEPAGPAAPREIRVDPQGYIISEKAAEKPPVAPTVPTAGEVMQIAEVYRTFGQFSARQNLQRALLARDQETANLKALLARWEAAVGVPLERVEEIESGRAGGGTAATPPTPAAG